MENATITTEQALGLTQAQPEPQPNVQTQSPESHLEQQGEQQAPAPTSDPGNEGADTSASEAQFNPDEFLRMKQEYDALQKEAQENQSLLSEIRRVAEEQQAQAAHQQQRSEIQKQVADLMRSRGVEDDDAAAAIAEAMFGRIDETRNSFQQQMQDYQRSTDDYVQGAVWAAHGPGYADYLITERKLDPVLKQRLMTAKSEKEMTAIADTLQEAQSYYQRQAYERTVQEQEDKRRSSGVYTITGINSGPISGEKLDSNNPQQMRSVLRQIVGS